MSLESIKLNVDFWKILTICTPFLNIYQQPQDCYKCIYLYSINSLKAHKLWTWRICFHNLEFFTQLWFPLKLLPSFTKHIPLGLLLNYHSSCRSILLNFQEVRFRKVGNNKFFQITDFIILWNSFTHPVCLHSLNHLDLKYILPCLWTTRGTRIF